MSPAGNYTCIKFLLTVTILLFQSLISSSQIVAYNDTATASSLVKRLGNMDNSINFRILDSLKEFNDKYFLAGKLISDLDTTGDWAFEDGKNALGHYKFEKLHIIWCWRALRMITSLDFFGTTTSEKGVTYFDSLYIKETGKIKYCYVWPLKSVVYVAPADAQIEIIKQWKEWYRKEGKTFDFKTMKYSSTVDF